MVTLSKFFEIAHKLPYNYAIVVGEKRLLTKEKNRITWKLFSEAVNKECTPEIIQRAEQRYKFHIEPNLESPLLVKHILGIQAAQADTIREDLGSLQLKCEDLREITFHQIPSVQSVYTLKGGVPASSFKEVVLPNRLQMDQKRLQLYSGIENLKGGAYLQRLSMAIVSHPLDKGKILPAPNGRGGRDYYEIVHLGGKHGLELCALAPVAIDSQLDPIIVFQPTQLSMDKQAIPTLLNDTESDLGYSGYQASKKFIEEVMADPRFSKGNVILTGFSLGGNHAQRLLADYPTHFKRIAIFNAPAPTDRKIALKFRKIANDRKNWKRPDTLKLRIYRNVFIKDGERFEDLAPGFGTIHVGSGVKNPLVDVKVIELRYKTQNVGIKDRHIKRLLDCDPAIKNRISKVVYKGNKADKLLDNTKRKGKVAWQETVRQWGTCFIYPLLHCIWASCRSILNFFLDLLFGEENNKHSSSET